MYCIVIICISYVFRYLYYLFGVIKKAWESSKQVVSIHINDVHYPVSYWTEKGSRPYQEDRHHACKGLGHPDSSLYGIFDGHGGMHASQFCKENMIKYIIEQTDLHTNTQHAIAKAFKRTDDEFVELGKVSGKTDGTTAVVALISNRVITVANAGDSRCILVYKNGTAQEMSVDHKPDRCVCGGGGGVSYRNCI